jgi:hypothetical protein
MDYLEQSPPEKKMVNFRTLAGGILVTAGAVLFLDRYLQTGWLSLLVMPVIGLLLYQWGVRLRHTGLLVAGGILSGTGMGITLALNPSAPGQPFLLQAGYLAVFFALGCGAIVVGTALLTSRTAWWALIAGGAVGAVGYGLLYSPQRPLDMVLYLALGVGLPLILWGTVARIIGLVIPGCIITTVGAGVYQAWLIPQAANGLMKTGVMLIWFALGWVLITFFWRVLFNKFAWWPLIPGGILAMVGFGLYIGGDPDNALGFIGNTGSIALIIFGLYLLLMRKGIHH